jgi:hypothetical protein
VTDVEALYARRVRPALFGRAEPSQFPVAVLLGGQPGAGKSRSAAIVRRIVQPQRLNPIIGDDLRPFHPDYDHLVRNEPLAMPAATAAASARWVEMAIADAQEHRYPVLIETTFRRPEITVATAREFRSHGFDVHLVALAVPDWESRIGILDRYVSDHALHRAARWTSLEAHDVSYAATPDAIASAIDAGVVNQVTILDRQGRTLHNSRRPVRVAALAALERGRHRLPIPGEADGHSARLDAALAYLQQTEQLNEQTVPLIDALRRDRDVIAALEARGIGGLGYQSGGRSMPPPEPGQRHLRLVDPDRGPGIER